MNSSSGIYGKKIGFTQYFSDKGEVVRATVIEAGPVTVVGKRTLEKDGYTAVIMGMVEAKEKHLTKADLGQFAKAGVTPKRVVKELRCNEEFSAKFEVGNVIKLDQVFTPGVLVDVKGKSKGHGFTGVMVRWNFKGFKRTHGVHEYQRHGGSIGTNMTPGRTLPNLKMPGQMGGSSCSVQNLELVKIDVEKNQLFLRGSVPGAKNDFVLIRHAVKLKVRKKR